MADRRAPRRGPPGRARRGRSRSSLGRSSETALALRQKELDVHDFFAEALRRNNIRGTWAADRRTKVNDAPRAAEEGLRAADRARLSDEKALGEAG